MARTRRTRRTRQLADSSMILNEPTTGGRFRPSRRRVDAEAEAARIHRSTQLAVDYGMLPPRAGRPIRFAVPPQTPNTDQDYDQNYDHDQNNSIEDHSVYQPAIAHARYHRLERYAAQRQQRSDEWQMLVNQATSTYLHCQQSSHNWTNLKFPMEAVPYDCTCAPDTVHWRSVDLIGLLQRHVAFQIPFCKCTPDVIRLLHFGFLASSAKKPRTAFSVPLVQLHHDVWQASSISTGSFIKGLSKFLDARHARPMLSRGSKRKRQLRVPFSHSTDLFFQISLASDRIVEQGLQYTNNQKWARRCPRCFGPNDHEHKANLAEPDFIVAMDGNYQQRHYAHASKDTPSDDQYPPIFLQPSEVNSSTTLCEETEVHVAGIEDPCAASHKVADDLRDATTWEKCDDSGLFGVSCRHDVPLLYANVYKTGEKLYYPISILKRIFSDYPQSKIGILYDIGCQLETHINKRNFFPDKQSSLTYGTSVFHAYVHEWSCQVKYNPRLNKWWGLSDGEGLERLWSFLSSLISSLRVSTRLHRLNAIHARSQYYGEGLNETAAEWLHNKLLMAKKTITDSGKGLQKLHQLPILNNTEGRNYTNEFLQQQWDDEQAYHLGTNRSFQEKQEKELGRLLRLEDQLESEWSAASLNVAEAIARARVVSSLTAEIEEQRRKVGNVMHLLNMTEPEKDQLLKIWHTKTELRQKFLALIEEKRPLTRVCRPGEQSTLGTSMQQKLLDALRKRAKQLHNVLNEYVKRVEEFAAEFPDRAHPIIIDYNSLMRIDSDDAFWNDGLFTNQNEPWAVDPNTQKGIRLLASLNRGLEEERRIGWEVRRAMKWAIQEHSQLVNLIREFTGPINPDHQFFSLTDHPTLRSLGTIGRTLAAKALVHARFVHICNLQWEWNHFCLQVLADTTSQEDDLTIRCQWSDQMTTLRLDISQLPGNNDNLLATLEGRVPHLEDQEDQEEDDDGNESDDDDYLNEVEGFMNQTMIDELANE
ncbi:hypothetical protein PCASD_16209, partial [Puccinia coronata f. sp. avenae]